MLFSRQHWLLTVRSQGSYSQEGDIVVLCAYLGQLAKVRDALRDKVAIVIDERDQAELAMREEDDGDDDGSEEPEGPQVEHVKVSQRVYSFQASSRCCTTDTIPKVRLRTVDNYQGEESKVSSVVLAKNSTHPPNRSSYFR
jgi:hypothetical protein